MSNTIDNDDADSRISKVFYDPTADVTFQSSDGILFRIHKDNLKFTCGGFPPAELSTFDEIVSLTEPGNVLELLFEFVYLRRHPLLEDIEFTTLCMLSEAAEKYEVYPAMGICFVRMREYSSTHPIEVLNYATKHGHARLMDEAAAYTICSPFDLDKVILLINDNILKPWLLYNLAWTRVALYDNNLAHWINFSEFCPYFEEAVMDLGGDIPSNFKSNVLENLKNARYREGHRPCPTFVHIACETAAKTYKNGLISRISSIPRFSDFM